MQLLDEQLILGKQKEFRILDLDKIKNINYSNRFAVSLMASEHASIDS